MGTKAPGPRDLHAQNQFIKIKNLSETRQNHWPLLTQPHLHSFYKSLPVIHWCIPLEAMNHRR